MISKKSVNKIETEAKKFSPSIDKILTFVIKAISFSLFVIIQYEIGRKIGSSLNPFEFTIFIITSLFTIYFIIDIIALFSNKKITHSELPFNLNNYGLQVSSLIYQIVFWCDYFKVF